MTKTYDIVGKRKIYYIVSSTIIIVALIVSIIAGVKVDIQFKGGTMISYSYTGDVDSAALAKIATDTVGQTVSAKEGTNFSDKSEYIELSFVSKTGLTADLQSKLTETLKTSFAENKITLLSSNDVKPSIGREFFEKCLVAVIFSSIILVIYIALRFKRIGGWSAGAMAVVALIHDCLIVFATFVLFRIPIDANFMAVVLTILGYSINDTIVIYDRIRENQKLLDKNISKELLVNTSLNECLARSLNTSISTIMSMVVVSIIAVIFGVTSILSFSFPLIIGMISGVYSSNCIATPLWIDWQNHKAKRKPSYAKKK